MPKVKGTRLTKQAGPLASNANAKKSNASRISKKASSTTSARKPVAKSQQQRKPATDDVREGTNEEEVAATSAQSQEKLSTEATAAAGATTTAQDPGPQGPHYLLLARLNGTTDPAITRLLLVPASLTFQQMNEVMQIAFGWAHCHAWDFSVHKMLEPGEQPNWMTGLGKRVMTIRSETQMIGNDFSNEKTREAGSIKLSDVYGDPNAKRTVSYEYDHGDSWGHDIIFMGHADPAVRQAMMIPPDFEVVCLGGEGHPAAEDCGGEPGWEDLKELFAKPRAKDTDGRKQWYKQMCANGDPKGLDPYKWDIFAVNDQLYKLRKGL